MGYISSDALKIWLKMGHGRVGFQRTLRGPNGRDALDKTSNLRNTSRGSVFLRPREATNSAILRSSTSSVISSISAGGG